MSGRGFWPRRTARVLVAILPVPLALLMLRVLVPDPVVLERAFWPSRLSASYPVWSVAALCVLLASLLSYWSGVLGKSVQPARADSARPRGATAYVGFALLLLGAIVAIRFVRSTLVTPARVQGGSMLPTLENGDWLLVDRRSATLPARGDAIVFDYVGAKGRSALVKRVIGLPGDRIDMRAGRPVINGWAVPSCEAGSYTYALADGAVHGQLQVEFLGDQSYLTLLTAHSRDASPFVVPPGQLFVLGDSRNESTDSRSLAAGRPSGVPLSQVIGRARWFLFGSHRDGSVDWTRFGERLAHELHLEGVDIRELETRIARCLSQRPAQTRPPFADADAAPRAN